MQIINFIKSQSVLFISFILALSTVFIIPPDSEYPAYINFSTLILLFCLMGAVAGFRKCGIFKKLSDTLTMKCSSLRALTFVMMNVCFFTSMFITNDVALLTFVPVTVLIFDSLEIQDNKSCIAAIVIETAAANLGSMLLPTGNPQNIFLCSKFDITPLNLLQTLIPFGIISYVILSLSILLISKTEIKTATTEKNITTDFSKRTPFLCCGVFIISLLTVSGLINEYVCLAICTLLLITADFKLFAKIDYALLATFVCFFVFTGNIGRIPAVQSLLESIINGKELAVSVFLSQIISNVPAAVLASSFTDNSEMLLIGTNIGGLGTPIASLASLIAYKLYMTGKSSNSGRFMLFFLIYNFAFLSVLFISALVLNS